MRRRRNSVPVGRDIRPLKLKAQFPLLLPDLATAVDAPDVLVQLTGAASQVIPYDEARLTIVTAEGRQSWRVARPLADGVVITPSHNPPEDGGFKYNPPNGGPAETDVTKWVQDRANELLRAGHRGVKRVAFTGD